MLDHLDSHSLCKSLATIKKIEGWNKIIKKQTNKQINTAVVTRHFIGHFNFMSSCPAPQIDRHGRQSWNSADRTTPRRKGKEVLWSRHPVFQPLGPLAVNEVTKGHRAHKRLLHVGGSWAQVSTIHQPCLQGATERQNPVVELALENFSWTWMLF